MEMTIILSRIFGLYLVLISLIMLIKPNSFKSFIQAYINEPAFIVISGIIALIFGCILVTIHFVWVDYLSCIVSVIGIIMLVKGIVRLLFPQSMKNIAKYYLNNSVFFTTAIITLIIGAFLLYEGYILMPEL